MYSEQQFKHYRRRLTVWAAATALAISAAPPTRAAAEEAPAAAPAPATAEPASAEPAAADTNPAAPAAPTPSTSEQPSAPVAAAAKAPAAAPAPASRVKSDGSALARAAAASIQADQSLVAPDALSLRISAKGGVITLAGAAGTIYDREQATRDAEGVKGVTGVRPSINIKAAAPIEPSALESAVIQAVKDANVAGANFAARATDDGSVQLSGDVSHEWIAINAVKRVQGVTAIAGYAARMTGKLPPRAEAELTVVAPDEKQDAVLLQAVQDALKTAGLERITVSIKQGVVSITGQPAGLREWYAATRAVSLVEGVLGVDQNVKIQGRAWRQGDVRAEAAVVADARKNLRRLGLSGIGIRVNGTSVLLTGRVASGDAAYAAVEAVLKVGGVQEVVNALSYPTQAARS